MTAIKKRVFISRNAKNLLMRSKNRTRNVAVPPWRVKLTARETKLSRHLNRDRISAERGGHGMDGS